MQIHVKLMGALRSKLPGGKATLDVAERTTVAMALEQLGLTAAQVHLVLVGGGMAHDRTRPLTDGEEMTVFPPVAGG